MNIYMKSFSKFMCVPNYFPVHITLVFFFKCIKFKRVSNYHSTCKMVKQAIGVGVEVECILCLES